MAQHGRKRPVPQPRVASSAPRLKTCCQTASSGPFPFCVDTARQKPHECKEKVTTAVWEEIQQKIMDKTYVLGKVDNYDDSRTHATLLDEPYLSSLYFKGVQVARLHRDIANIVLDSRSQALKFEVYWQKLAQDKRKSIILNALEYAEATTVAFGPLHRRYCPDLTISSLAVENNGFGFVKLIRQITQSAIHFNKAEDYFPVPCQAFDTYYEINFKGQDSSLPLSRSKRSWQTMQQHERNQFVAILALSVFKMMDLVGESFLPAVLVKKPRNIHHCERHEIRGAFVVPTTCQCGPCQSLMKEACTSCRRYIEEIEDAESTKLSYCEKCKKAEYSVPYCSRDCQIKDWKTGNHKAHCGKKLSELALPPFGWSTPPVAPPSSLPLQYYHCDNRVRPTPHLCPNPHLCAHESDAKAIYHLLSTNNLYENSLKIIDEFNMRLVDHSAVMLTPARKHLDSLLLEAIASREEETIRAFICHFTSLTLDRPGGFKDPSLQLAAEWEIEVGKIRGWVREGIFLAHKAKGAGTKSLKKVVEKLGLLANR